MKTKDEANVKTHGRIGWVGVALVTLIAFFLTYYYHFSAPIKALIWLLWFVFTLVLGFFTPEGKQLFAFGKEAKIELQKVVWPNRQETIQTTTIVMAMVGITGFVLWAIDSMMLWGIGKITHLG
jgi:preprotein translocase subunit SecE